MGSIASKAKRKSKQRRTVILLARSLGAALALMRTLLEAQDWNTFVKLRDEIEPKLAEMEKVFDGSNGGS